MIPRPCCACAGSNAGAASGCLFAPASFAVAAGSIVWIRGANGQGKTTLLRTLAGLAAPAAGTIAWRDAPALEPRPLYLAHANALKEDLTVAESLRFLLHLAGSRVDDRRCRRRPRTLRPGQPRERLRPHALAGPAPPRRPGPTGGRARAAALAPRRALRRARRERRRRPRRGHRRPRAARRQRRSHQPSGAADRRPGARDRPAA